MRRNSVAGYPDGTGPYGRGIGPGAGRGDGTGLMYQDRMQETQDRINSELEQRIKAIATAGGAGLGAVAGGAIGGGIGRSYDGTFSFNNTKKGVAVGSVLGALAGGLIGRASAGSENSLFNVLGGGLAAEYMAGEMERDRALVEHLKKLRDAQAGAGSYRKSSSEDSILRKVSSIRRLLARARRTGRIFTRSAKNLGSGSLKAGYKRMGSLVGHAAVPYAGAGALSGAAYGAFDDLGKGESRLGSIAKGALTGGAVGGAGGLALNGRSLRDIVRGTGTMDLKRTAALRPGQPIELMREVGSGFNKIEFAKNNPIKFKLAALATAYGAGAYGNNESRNRALDKFGK